MIKTGDFVEEKVNKTFEGKVISFHYNYLTVKPFNWLSKKYHDYTINIESAKVVKSYWDFDKVIKEDSQEIELFDPFKDE